MLPRQELAASINQAASRIGDHIRRTPVEYSPWLSAVSGAEVHLKLENHQLTGSFKLRGALNRLLAGDEETRRRGFVAASTGNHGLAMAHAAELVGAPLTVFVPTTADADKVALLEQRGIQVRPVGDDCTQAETAARAFAQRHNQTYVSPYNDPQVIAGQGTLGLELGQQVPELDAVFVALGGGGLLAGVATYLRTARPEIQIIGCSPVNSAVMAHSLAAGRLLDLPSEPTLSDGTAGGVEAGSITFELCQQLVDRCALVPESAIANALREFTSRHHSLIEGAAAVAIAGLLAEDRRLGGRRVAVVLCGANIAPSLLSRILAGSSTP